MDEPAIAFIAAPVDGPPLDIRINFGMFSGREATQAEIDDLARALLTEVEVVTIVAEQRTIVDREMEASVHQVRVEIPHDLPAGGADRLLELARSWALECVAERHVEISEV